MTCHLCNHELETVEHTCFRGDVLTLATCMNPNCDLHRVTLQPEALAALTAGEVAAYAKSKRELNERLAMMNQLVQGAA